MTILRQALDELVSLFVDDGWLALATLVLVVLATLAESLFGLPPLAGGLLIGAGSIAILARSIARSAKR